VLVRVSKGNGRGNYMNGYVAFYSGKRIEVRATSLYAAKLEAIRIFKVRKSQEHMVSVMLCERSDGSEVVHTAVD